MKNNPQRMKKVKALLSEALAGVEGYVNDWPKAPLDFTTEAELRRFAAKLREMKESLDEERAVEILGLWRIMETWPHNNQLGEKIVEAELAYERLADSEPR